ILPYIDQAPLYNALNVGNTRFQVAVANNVVRESYPAFRCPSDTAPQTNSGVKTDGTTPGRLVNMLSVATSTYIGVNNCSPMSATRVSGQSGVFYQNSKIGFRDLNTDGTSNVVVVGERAWKVGTLVINSGVLFGMDATPHTRATDAATEGAAVATYDINLVYALGGGSVKLNAVS
ncbi:MAG: DUF1559 domain-containing protein, partial [Planctomycetaceae bacterium]|nr:DUF1559 domain-containing protein [Planctomycetaceae bacterium]